MNYQKGVDTVQAAIDLCQDVANRREVGIRAAIEFLKAREAVTAEIEKVRAVNTDTLKSIDLAESCFRSALYIGAYEEDWRNVGKIILKLLKNPVRIALMELSKVNVFGADAASRQKPNANNDSVEQAKPDPATSLDIEAEDLTFGLAVSLINNGKKYCALDKPNTVSVQLSEDKTIQLRFTTIIADPSKSKDPCTSLTTEISDLSSYSMFLTAIDNTSIEYPSREDPVIETSIHIRNIANPSLSIGGQPGRPRILRTNNSFCFTNVGMIHETLCRCGQALCLKKHTLGAVLFQDKDLVKTIKIALWKISKFSLDKMNEHIYGMFVPYYAESNQLVLANKAFPMSWHARRRGAEAREYPQNDNTQAVGDRYVLKKYFLCSPTHDRLERWYVHEKCNTLMYYSGDMKDVRCSFCDERFQPKHPIEAYVYIPDANSYEVDPENLTDKGTEGSGSIPCDEEVVEFFVFCFAIAFSELRCCNFGVFHDELMTVVRKECVDCLNIAEVLAKYCATLPIEKHHHDDGEYQEPIREFSEISSRIKNELGLDAFNLSSIRAHIPEVLKGLRLYYLNNSSDQIDKAAQQLKMRPIALAIDLAGFDLAGFGVLDSLAAKENRDEKTKCLDEYIESYRKSIEAREAQ